MDEPLIQELRMHDLPCQGDAWEPHILFRALADEPYALLLDSATAGRGKDGALNGRWSFIAADPFDTLTLRTGNAIAPFTELNRKLAALPAMTATKDMPPFIGGAAGLFGYGLARSLEHLPPEIPPFSVDDQHLPDMAIGFYDVVIAFDHHQDKAFIVSTGLPEKDQATRRERAEQRSIEMLARLKKLSPQPARASASCTPVSSGFTRAGYEASVARIIDYIRAGDIFQANFSQRFETNLSPDDDAYSLYLRLRCESPAPYSAFFNFGDGAVVSSSPEQFLSCREGVVHTRPIKGTRPRGKTTTEDESLAAELLSSPKDKAENVMIVDLLRNDLSKVCRDHSVVVEKLCALESFATVHHLVSTIRGELKADETAASLLAACFPGGSITGAPKRRAMEIIAELEPTTRAAYCGAMGYIGADGAMDTSITIRTMIVKDRRVTFQAGGGIVADSNPAAEYEETLVKACAMFRALGASVEELS